MPKRKQELTEAEANEAFKLRFKTLADAERKCKELGPRWTPALAHKVDEKRAGMYQLGRRLFW